MTTPWPFQLGKLGFSAEPSISTNNRTKQCVNATSKEEKQLVRQEDGLHG